MTKQHKTPCKECPFRKAAPRGYLGGNNPQKFTVIVGHDGFMACHLTMGKKTPEKQCAGRAAMFANQCKVSRDKSVMEVPKQAEVVSSIFEFMKHHGIKLTPAQFMGAEPLDL